MNYAMINSVVHKGDHKNKLLFVNMLSTDCFILVQRKVCLHILQGKASWSRIVATNEAELHNAVTVTLHE